MLKEQGAPKPWSSDRVFQRTYFCNVRREDDRVTKWIRKEWSPEKIGWDDYEFAMVVARFINWPPTLDAFSLPLTPASIFGVMEDLRVTGEKVWGNAYVITTHGIPMGKAAYLCERVLPAAYKLLGAGRWRGAYGRGPTLAARHRQLCTSLEGVASFMGAQIIADLKNTVGHPLYEATDWGSWSAPGPGSLRGLSWFYRQKITAQKYEGHMNGVMEYLFEHDDDAAQSLFSNGKFNMQDLQNCMCEYDKYMRVKSGAGRSKRNYDGA